MKPARICRRGNEGETADTSQCNTALSLSIFVMSIVVEKSVRTTGISCWSNKPTESGTADLGRKCCAESAAESVWRVWRDAGGCRNSHVREDDAFRDTGVVEVPESKKPEI